MVYYAKVMGKKLLIVESPTKANTIACFLNDDYKIISSKGHVRDLPKSKLGVDIDHDFKPEYKVDPKKRAVIKEMKKEAGTASKIVIATDPDREGEAIAWHISQILQLPDECIDRIVFHEISKQAIEEALTNPRKIEMNLVNAQQARRVLDRLVGYELSPFLWRKVRYGLSAGRVQSVAVRLIVDRERSIEKFKVTPFWKIFAYVGREKGFETRKIVLTETEQKSSKGDLLKVLNKSSKLWKFCFLKRGKVVGGDRFTETKDWIVEKIQYLPKNVKVSKVEQNVCEISPPPPFITSSLQRAAFAHFAFSASKTMKLAQDLYERGFITYMRTDSVKLSERAILSIRQWVRKNLGERYLPEKTRQYRTKQKLAQEAHEAIRPVDPSRQKLDTNFSKDHQKLYSLIWACAIASQVKNATVNNIDIEADLVLPDGRVDKENVLKAKLYQLIFDGFYRIVGIPTFLSQRKDFTPTKGELLYVDTWLGLEDHTNPPPRYTEASLVKKLESYGIGRPSTYATIIETIIKRGYVRREGRVLVPTENGILVNDLLVKHFPSTVDTGFTARMEDELDDVARGDKNWVDVVKEFYVPFKQNLDEKEKELKKEEVTVLGKSEEKCSECGAFMVIKISKHGKFLSCSRFPECKGMKPITESTDEEFKKKYEVVEKCEKCGAKMVLKAGRFGKFWACERYPQCNFTAPLKMLERCPECNAPLVERKGKRGKSFVGCSSYPKCRYIKPKIQR